MLYSAAMRQGDIDWLQYVNTTFDVAMHGHYNAVYDQALEEYFGLKPPVREPGIPNF
jgi:polar amino acid transport system substrate-binding protein